MTRSELIAILAQRFPQLMQKDAEMAANEILEAIAATLTAGSRVEIRGFGSFFLELSATTYRQEPENRGKGGGSRQTCAALQGRQGIA